MTPSNRLKKDQPTPGMIQRPNAMQRTIRILEFSCAGSEGGGPDKTILAGAVLADPRFEVTVCYFRDGSDERFGIQERAEQMGINFVSIPEGGKFDRRAQHALRQLVRERRIDIVHAHGYKADLITLLLARREPIIPLSTMHGYTGHTWRERLIYYPMNRRVLRRYPRVIAVSSDLRQVLLRAGARPERVQTILNGIDPDRFRRQPEEVARFRSELGLGPDEIALGGIGRLERQKRFDLLIDAFAELLIRRPQLRLLIAGEGSLRASLEAHAARRGVAGVCRFLGHRRNVAEVYQALDVFVQSSDYEGTPNVVLEAMALETPLVATDVGGTSELVRDRVHGLVVPPRDVPAVIKAVEYLLDRPGETCEFVAAGRRRIEAELSFAARVKAVERVYDELMAEGPRSRLSVASI